MKQITELDDPRLVKGLAHPLRIQILRVLQDRVASPSEIAEELGAPLGNVSYHVRFLARIGLIELAGTEPRRGAVEHYYRTVGRVHVTDRAWAQVPGVVRDAVVGSTLAQSGRVIAAAAGKGGFDRDDAHASRAVLTLDEQGFGELSAVVGELVIRAHQIERDSTARLEATPGRDDGVVKAGLVTMLFDHADVGAAVDGGSADATVDGVPGGTAVVSAVESSGGSAARKAMAAAPSKT